MSTMDRSGQVRVHRLLDRNMLEQLFGLLLANQETHTLAIVHPDGRLFAGHLSEQSVMFVQRHLNSTQPNERQTTDELILQPLFANNRIVGYLIMRESAKQVDLVTDIIAHMLQQGIEKRSMGAETLLRYRELNLLYEIGETLGASISPDEVPAILLAAVQRVVRSVAVEMWTAATDGAMFKMVRRVGDPDAFSELDHLPTPTARITEPFADAINGSVVLTVPLRIQERTRGAMRLVRRQADAIFSSGEQKLLTALGHQAAIAVERGWMVQNELAAHRLEQELETARRIQRSLLPQTPPTITGWDIAAYFQPAQHVSGDYYDFIPLEENRFGLLIADVTNKGVPAALFGVYTNSVIRTNATLYDDPAAVLTQTNQRILADQRSPLFLSALYAVLHSNNPQLSIASAGHDYPVWYQAERRLSVEVSPKGSILGAFNDIDVETQDIEMATGDLLIFYTDGITEARNPARAFFGAERLHAIAQSHYERQAHEIAAATVQAVTDFAAGTSQADDITVMVIKRTANHHPTLPH